MSDVDSSHATFPRVVPESVQFTLDEPWSFEDLDDAVADIANELSAGLIRTFRKTIRRG